MTSQPTLAKIPCNLLRDRTKEQILQVSITHTQLTLAKKDKEFASSILLILHQQCTSQLITKKG